MQQEAGRIEAIGRDDVLQFLQTRQRGSSSVTSNMDSGNKRLIINFHSCAMSISIYYLGLVAIDL